MLQNDGKGIKFVDKDGVDRVRIHAPENNPKFPSTANTNSGWILRIPFSRKNILMIPVKYYHMILMKPTSQ